MWSIASEKRARMRGDCDIHWGNRPYHLLSRTLLAALSQTTIMFSSHGAGTHSIEGKKWQENAEHIAQDIWGCSAFMLSKWDSYCRVDFGSPSQNFFRAPPARSAGKPMEHSYRYRLRFGGPIWVPKLPSIFPRVFENFQATDRSISHARRYGFPKIATGNRTILVSLSMFCAGHRWYMCL